MNPQGQLQVPDRAPDYRGKVRDIYDLGDRLLLVATDRISAFDVVLPETITDKGAILTSITRFWFEQLGDRVANHLISLSADDLEGELGTAAAAWGPRFMLVEKLEMLPIECIVRGYLVGSGWKDYERSGSVCGIDLPQGLQLASELPEPIFTPSTKAQEGHDINISGEEAAKLIGQACFDEVRRLSLEVYGFGRNLARERGIILADTKFEFGRRANGQLVLADEVLTPDSSRFWPADEVTVGENPPSFDKQYVRDHLIATGWDKSPPPPSLPDEVVVGTARRYQEIYELLTGKTWNGQ